MVRIYGLVDPRDGKLRYVGKTEQTLKARLHRHKSYSKQYPNSLRSRWILTLLNEGTEPTIHLIEEVPDEDWKDAERAWIAYFWNLYGPQLYNASRGGKTQRSGFSHTDKTKERISEANKGNVPWNKGVPKSEEWKEAHSKRMSGEGNPMHGRSHSEEAKRKMSEARKGKNTGEDHHMKDQERKKKVGLKQGLLSADEVREIRRRYEEEDITQKKLARDYGIRPSTMSNVIRRISYDYIE